MKAPADILAERSPAWRELLTGRKEEQAMPDTDREHVPEGELLERLQAILDECKDDFHSCERCGHQDDNATRDSDLYILLRGLVAFAIGETNR